MFTPGLQKHQHLELTWGVCCRELQHELPPVREARAHPLLQELDGVCAAGQPHHCSLPMDKDKQHNQWAAWMKRQWSKRQPAHEEAELAHC